MRPRLLTHRFNFSCNALVSSQASLSLACLLKYHEKQSYQLIASCLIQRSSTLYSHMKGVFRQYQRRFATFRTFSRNSYICYTTARCTWYSMITHLTKGYIQLFGKTKGYIQLFGKQEESQSGFMKISFYTTNFVLHNKFRFTQHAARKMFDKEHYFALDRNKNLYRVFSPLLVGV